LAPIGAQSNDISFSSHFGKLRTMVYERAQQQATD